MWKMQSPCAQKTTVSVAGENRAILPPASGLPYAPLRPAQMLATSGRVLT